MIIRTLLILAAFAAPSFAQTGGRYSAPPPAPVPPKPVVIATPAPAPATPRPKPKPRRRPAPPVDATAVTPEAATPAPAVVTAPAPAPEPAPAPAPAPVPEKPAIKKPAAPPVVKQPPAPVRSASATAYTAKVKAAFAKRWADAVQPHMSEFQPGNVSVVFKLDAEGKVTAFSVTENTSNEAFAKFCEQFVRDTAFDPPPAKSLADGQFEVPFTFWIY
jgi:TonB family protein